MVPCLSVLQCFQHTVADEQNLGVFVPAIGQETFVLVYQIEEVGESDFYHKKQVEFLFSLANKSRGISQMQQRNFTNANANSI